MLSYLTDDEVLALVGRLDEVEAEALECQELDFKEWDTQSLRHSVDIAIEMAVCMANGGGGNVVFGVREHVRGRRVAVRGVPRQVDEVRLQKAVYEGTEPRITAHVRSVSVREGTGRLLIMHIPPGMPPYTTAAGAGKIRVGRDCMPLTGSVRRDLLQAAGAPDFSGAILPGDPAALLSPAAMERLRAMAAEQHSVEELRAMPDLDLLSSVGAIRDGSLTVAGLLLAGRPESLERAVPHHRWQFHRMLSDREYAVPGGGRESLVVALYEIQRFIDADNPVTTVPAGLMHGEWPAFPRLALREALLNAFGHRDYAAPGAVDVRQYRTRLEIANPGRFIAGITPRNILHHPPAARNECLMEVLDRLRLVNRTNVGVPRMYAALLEDGHEPPVFEEPGDGVRVTLFAGPEHPALRQLARVLDARGVRLTVDHLLVLHYLLGHRQVTAEQAGAVTQRPARVAAETLAEMSQELQVLVRAGKERSRYFRLSAEVSTRLGIGGERARDARPRARDAEARVVAALRQGELSNADVRELTGLDRLGALRLVRRLAPRGVVVEGRGRGARYRLRP